MDEKSLQYSKISRIVQTMGLFCYILCGCRNRLVVIGSADGAILVIVLEANGNGKYYPITAYPAEKQDIVLYKRLKGGETDEGKK